MAETKIKHPIPKTPKEEKVGIVSPKESCADWYANVLDQAPRMVRVTYSFQHNAKRITNVQNVRLDQILVILSDMPVSCAGHPLVAFNLTVSKDLRSDRPLHAAEWEVTIL